MSIEIDGIKLADGIEDGMDPSGCSLWRGYRRSFMATGTCGMTSEATKCFLQDLGYVAETIISRPNLPIDRSMEHCMVRVNDVSENPLIIDPSGWQFLRYFGWDEAYDIMSGRQILPSETIVFRENAWQDAVSNIAKVALGFRDIEQTVLTEVVPADIDGEREPLSHGRLAFDISESDAIEAIRPIWNPANYQPFEQNNVDAIRWGRIISRHIPADVVTIR